MGCNHVPSEVTYDVIVVGAGPAGTIAAQTCAEAGLRVALLERNANLGCKPCGGAVPDRAVREFGIDRDDIGQRVKSLYVVSQSGNYTYLPRKGDIAVYRTSVEDPTLKKFDLYLAKRAKNASTELYNSTEVTGMVKREDGTMAVMARSAKGTVQFRGRIVIGADGFNSTVARSTGLRRPFRRSEFAVTVQREILSDRRVDDECEYHFLDSKISPLGFGWVYPKKKGFTIGLGVLASHSHGNLTKSLNYMIQKHPIVKGILPKWGKLCKVEGACIPMAQVLRIYDKGVMLVGDAAGQVNPMGGDGIYYAMKAGRLAALTAIGAISEGDTSEERLSKYQSEWMERRPLGNDSHFRGRSSRRSKIAS